MVTTSTLKEKLCGSEYDAALARIYKPEDIAAQKQRCIRVAEAFEDLFGSGRQVGVFSAPGRTEVGGNHTDHNHGKVLAAGVNLDAVAVASKNDEGIVRVKSEGYDMDVVDLGDLGVMPNERGRSVSLVRGVCAAFKNRGYQVGGFDAATASDVLSGSGLSSSAAFEVLLGTMLNYLYNDGKVSNVEIAKMAQYAENVYFGKPCGLMDQTACAVGGFITIDFKDPTNPVIEKLDFDLTGAGFALCIVNTGGNHADLNEDYASVPAEMKKVAAKLGVSVLRETSREALGKLVCEKGVREELGDRAILRAYHFFAENERVDKQVKALKGGDLDGFMQGVKESGLSSFRFLQNVYTTKNVQEQGLSLALCLTEEFLRGKKGVCRVHGGGFAGTIQAFVALEDVAEYAAKMNAVFGDGACHILSVRKAGACKVTD